MAGRNRFFVDNVSSEVTLAGEEFQHAKNVLRLGVGAEVTLLDNSGMEYTAIVSGVEKRSMLLHVLGESKGEREAKTKVRLLIGALKGDKTEWVVQKATELGVFSVGVFDSAYCSAYMNENKLERLNKVAREAAKQCMRSVAPEVTYHTSLQEALDSAQGYQHKLFACEFAKTSDLSLCSLSGSCAIVVGSEGGFSEEEFAQAKEAGFAGLTLGKRILRAETAAISLTAVVMHALGEWQ